MRCYQSLSTSVLPGKSPVGPKLVISSNHIILCHPLLLLPSIFPSIRVFSNQSVLHISWPKYWSFSFNISPSNEYSRLLSFRMDWFDLLAVQGTLRVFSNTTVHKLQFFPTSEAFPLTQFFASCGQSIEVSASASVLPMNIQNWSPLGWTDWISLQSKGLSESSPTPQFKSINSLLLSFLYRPTLTSTHDSWKNHSSD